MTEKEEGREREGQGGVYDKSETFYSCKSTCLSSFVFLFVSSLFLRSSDLSLFLLSPANDVGRDTKYHLEHAIFPVSDVLFSHVHGLGTTNSL